MRILLLLVIAASLMAAEDLDMAGDRLKADDKKEVLRIGKEYLNDVISGDVDKATALVAPDLRETFKKSMTSTKIERPAEITYGLDVLDDGTPVVSIVNTSLGAEFKKIGEKWFVYNRQLAEKIAPKKDSK